MTVFKIARPIGLSMTGSANVSGEIITATVTLAAHNIATYGVTQACDYRVFQRNGSDQASVRIVGTYTGSPTVLQYRWAGGAWATLDASPTGGVFDETVTLTGPGQGDLEVRADSNPADSYVSVGVGDVWVVAGQSNHVGFSGGAFVVPEAPVAHADWVACIFDKANVWRQNEEASGTEFDRRTGTPYTTEYPTADTVSGSYFGALATLRMADGVPVAFVPCARSSTAIAVWQPGYFLGLYEAMVERAGLVGSHAGVIWWQGETDANSGTSQAAYEADLNAILDQWALDVGSGWVLLKINTVGLSGSATNVRAAIDAVGASHASVLAVGDMSGTFAGSVHYDSTSEINAVAAAVHAVLP